MKKHNIYRFLRRKYKQIDLLVLVVFISVISISIRINDNEDNIMMMLTVRENVYKLYIQIIIKKEA